jgi:hypothetical protein
MMQKKKRLSKDELEKQKKDVVEEYPFKVIKDGIVFNLVNPNWCCVCKECASDVSYTLPQSHVSLGGTVYLCRSCSYFYHRRLEMYTSNIKLDVCHDCNEYFKVHNRLYVDRRNSDTLASFLCTPCCKKKYPHIFDVLCRNLHVKNACMICNTQFGSDCRIANLDQRVCENCKLERYSIDYNYIRNQHGEYITHLNKSKYNNLYYFDIFKMKTQSKVYNLKLDYTEGQFERLIDCAIQLQLVINDRY